MGKLIDYVCDELDDLERKANKGKLTAAEIQYGDMLAHFKKNLLTADAMEGDGYSGNYYRDDTRSSYARGVRRDNMGRYSRRYSGEVADMVERLRSMMDEAPNEQMRHEIQKLMDKMQNM